MTVSPTIYDRDGLFFDIAGFAEAIPESGRHRRVTTCARAVQEPYHWHTLLLRARGERPRDGGAAEQGYELAPLHALSSEHALPYHFVTGS